MVIRRVNKRGSFFALNMHRIKSGSRNYPYFTVMIE